MRTPRHVAGDLAILRLLASHPPFRHWRNTHLDPAARRLLRHANRQTLMTIAAQALRRLAS